MKLFNKLIIVFLLLPLIFIAGCKKNNLNPNNTANTGKILFTHSSIFNISASNDGIYTINMDGTGQQKLNINLPEKFYIYNNAASKASPDKKLIIFSGYDANYFNGNIYTCNANGSNFKKIINGGNNLICLISDTYTIQQQQKVFYIKVNEANYLDLDYEVWTANIDGSNPTEIKIALPWYLSKFGNEPPKISPDGSTILFCAISSLDGNLGIYSCDGYGNNVQLVVGGKVSTYFTLGGTYILQQQTKILYLVTDNTSQNFVIANLDGTNQTIVNIKMPQNVGGQLNPPKLSTDGKTVFFAASQTGIYACNIDGSNLKLIMHDPEQILLGDIL